MILSAAELRCLSEVAQGQREADLYIEGGKLINVYSGEIYPANIAIINGRIAYMGNSHSMVGSETKILNANGYFLSPAYMECHAHPWVIYNPISLAEGVLPMGTTTLVYDNLPFFLNGGEDGVTKLIEWTKTFPLDLYWTVRVVSQSRTAEESDLFSKEALKRLFSLPKVLGVAEITRWSALAEGDQFLLELVVEARKLGLRIDGHTAGCSSERLNALAPIIDSCHEAITAEEVAHRLRMGLWVMLRHSSLRQDLPELLRAINETVLPFDSSACQKRNQCINV